ncbi:hypothetical protein [Catellatospora vulcania]|uniref:hypothetical protein n=1 Tax=Catellatospora vulcania TaxID=1460450 RepID=UPI0012D3FB90|nr:hypothetical protein [Catellatospora vulcania]
MTGLPPALAPWSAQLSVLIDEVALALGPLVRRITELIADDGFAVAPTGEPDGYDGLSPRGGPDRLLVSEWLLATELPDEFLRRAATGELSYLAAAARRPAPRGSVAAVVDCGPALWGAPRLAQLATLLVLHRRAAERGVPFELHVLDAAGATPYGGTLEQVLRTFLKARSHLVPDPDTVRAALAGLPEQTWLLTAPALAAAVGHPRTVAYEEGTWTAAGPAEVRLWHQGRRFALPMPPAGPAVRLLRGTGFANWRDPDAVPRTRAGLRLPVFPDTSTMLLARGGDDRTVVSAPVLDGRMRRHGFSRPVLTAWRQGRRVLALTEVGGDRMLLEVAGRPLPGLQYRTWPREELRWRPDRPLRPVHAYGGGLLVESAGSWWRLTAAGAVEKSDVVAVRSLAGGNLVLARDVGGERTTVTDRPDLPGGCLLTPDESGGFAWSEDDCVWLSPGGNEFLPGGGVLGVTLVRGEPSMIESEPDGSGVFLTTERGRRELTRWSYGGGPPSLHPGRPWLAVTRTDGTVEVVDLDADRVVRQWEPPS